MSSPMGHPHLPQPEALGAVPPPPRRGCRPCWQTDRDSPGASPSLTSVPAWALLWGRCLLPASGSQLSSKRIIGPACHEIAGIWFSSLQTVTFAVYTLQN